MADARVKQEIVEYVQALQSRRSDEVSESVPLIELSSSDSSDSSDSDNDDATVSGRKRFRVPRGLDEVLSKKKKLDGGVVLPLGFLDPLPPEEPPALVPAAVASPVEAAQRSSSASKSLVDQSCKLFWKAGEYEGAPCGDFDSSAGGLDHVRVHPKFLHSNATSHKWALGAFAELLDNSLDEICNGATYVNVDMLESKIDRSRMLLIEDNGGGMDPEKMRQCMSLGYSAKSKIANTIGQYGNGFKTSTMRLGADVIVFSRCCGKDGKSPTQSIGLLSYTFLRSTGKEDIVVPMIDYEKGGREWNKLLRSSASDWNKNVETIMQWSPFSSESDLLQQFNFIKEHGTRIIIYNLWEDFPGQLELEFDSDPSDIQIRGVNRDEKNIQMAKQFPNSRHFLTYRHSLRSYASILYLRLPPGFRIILRGKDVEHHNVVNDMMMTQEVTYRPQPGADGVPKDYNMLAVVTIGFVKDAKHHIDVQGFNVYHKNRLIKPFWRLWNAAGSDGRGVIGVLEANFVEPAHDKQGFERTIVLSRLESRLQQMQKTYWTTYCHKIGYAPRRNKKLINESAGEISPDYLLKTSSQSKKKVGATSGKASVSNLDKRASHSNHKQGGKEFERTPETVDYSHGNGHASSKSEKRMNMHTRPRKEQSYLDISSPSAEDDDDDDIPAVPPEGEANGRFHKASKANNSFGKDGHQNSTRSQTKGDDGNGNSSSLALEHLREENRELKERLKRKEGDIVVSLESDLEREREKCKLLETELREARQKIEDMNKEQDSLIDIFSEERDRRDLEEQNLRKKLKEASNTIQELLEKVRVLDKMKTPNGKSERR